MKAWHFLGHDKRLGYGDGRLVRVGHTFRCDPDRIALCEYGFHGSVKALDAIYYARGPIACRVEMGGRIIRGDDKIVASERTVLAMVDATRILHEFACWCAERAPRRIENPDRRLAAAIERKWLRGLLGWDDGSHVGRLAIALMAHGEIMQIVWQAARYARGAAEAERAAQNRKLTRMLTKGGL